MNTPARIAATVLSLAIGAATAGEQMDDASKKSGVQQAKDTQIFFETLGSAGDYEVQAGRLAQERGHDPAVKEFGTKMVTDHTEAGKEVEALAAKKNLKLSHALLKKHKDMLDKLRKKTKPDEFDAEYRAQMVASHKEALDLLQKQSSSPDADVAGLANKLLPKIQEHAQMAEQLPKGS